MVETAPGKPTGSDEIPESTLQAASDESSKPLDTVQKPSSVRRRTKLKPLLLAVGALIVAAGLGFAGLKLLDRKPSPNSQGQQIQDESTPDASTPIEKLLYAYKDGATTYIRELTIEGGDKKTLVEYDDTEPLDDTGAFQPELKANASLSRDDMVVAYIENDGLKTLNLNTGITETHIEQSLASSAGDLKWEPPLPPAPQQTKSIRWPEWSADGKSIGLVRSHGSGITSAALFQIEAKAFADLGDTTRGGNVDQSDTVSFTVKGDASELKDARALAQYFIAEQGGGEIINAVFAGAGESIVAVVEKMSEGPLTDGSAVDQTLLRIDTSDGSSTNLAEGGFGSQLALSKDGRRAWAVEQTADGFVAREYDLAAGKETRAVTPDDLSPDTGEEVVGMEISYHDRPIIELTYKQGENYTADIYDGANNTKLATFEVSRSSALNILGVF